MAQRKLYAALIGINAYEKANSLNGCIKDVLNFDRILRNLCSQQKGQLKYEPLYLLSPHGSDVDVINAYEKSESVNIDFSLPTFENITLKGFDHLGLVSDEDICVLYYSGHGSYMEASPEFWHTKSSHQNETIVCMDSRSTARDLVDKELAFLLYKTLKDKSAVHCLVIMDSCHSGDNTRAVNLEVNPVKYRQEKASSQQLKIEDYIGFKENFFEIKNGKASFKTANYVHLAACRDNEKAQDGFSGGIFSRGLAELLNNDGKNQSYRNLIQSLAATISIQNGQQNPVAFSANNNNLDTQFLGGKFIPYKPSYAVRYIAGDEVWQLQAGSLQGIVPSANGRKTEINIEPLNIRAEVVESGDFTATLKGTELDKLDKDSNVYIATITRLAIQPRIVGITERLKKFPALLEKLINADTNGNHIYFELDMEGTRTADYMTDVFERDGDYYFYLTQPQNDMPIFKSEIDADSFLKNVDAVAKWIYVKNLKSDDSIFSENDFVFTAEIIEGKNLTIHNIDTLSGKMASIKPGGQIDLSYKNDKNPLLKFSVEINPASKLQECYIQVLYLDSLFGIGSGFSEAGTNHLTKSGKFELKTNADGKYYNLIKFHLDPEYAGYNINEITEQLKIFVSARPNIQLNAYQQRSLTLEAGFKNTLNRSISNELFDTSKEARWSVFDFGIRIIGPKKDRELIAGGETDFSSFSLQVPNGFNAIATAVTNADGRIANRDVDNSYNANKISPAIWGDALTENLPFGDAFGSLAGSSVMALELGVVEGDKMPALKEGEELVVKTKGNTAVTRSVEGYQATTIPYGFDEETQLYFPLGYEDESGNIHIKQLPKVSTGSLVSEAVTTRSILGSIKLYFKKLLMQPTNTLTLHSFTNGKWQAITEPVLIKKAISELKPDQKLPLVVHGIFGDTKGMIEGLKEDKELAVLFPAILSYDFENLNSKVPLTAQELKNVLKEITIGQVGVPKVTIIAHSMGGLVSRWLIEKEGGAGLVEKLIMAGTPNGGSEWSKAGNYIITSANFLLTHALNVTGPIKYAITGLSFYIKKLHDPEATLKDMGTNSQLIKELSASARPSGIPYYLIGSNTGLYRNYEGSDSFLGKVKNMLMEKLVFPGCNLALFNHQPNDMAVTLDSMKTMPDFDFASNMQTLPGDHISYFSESTTRKAIIKLANE